MHHSIHKPARISYALFGRFFAKRSVGLVVSDEAVSYVECDYNANRAQPYKIRSFGAFSLPVGTIYHGQVKKPEVLRKVLLSIRSKARFRRVHVVIPQEVAEVFSLNLEVSDREDIHVPIYARLKELLPADPAELRVECQVVRRFPHRAEVQVTTVARTVLSDYERVLRAAGFRVERIELTAQALARVAGVAAPVADRTQGQAVVSVQFNERTTTLSVISRGVVRLAHTVDVGSTMLLSALQKHHSISPEEAQQVKKTKGFLRKRQDPEVLYSVANELSKVSTAIDELIQEWQLQCERMADELPVERIMLTGLDVLLPGLERYLAEKSTVPVAIAQVWAGMFDFDQIVPEISFEDSLGYAPAIGAMITPFDRCA